MTHRPLLIAALLTLGACQRPAPAPEAATEAESAAPAPAPAAAVPSLEGTWEAVAFDGAPRAQPFAMTLSIAAGRVTLTSECVTRLFSYTQERNLVSFTPLAGGSQCGRGLTADESGAGKALKNGTMAIFDDDGAKVTISGSGGNLALERR